MPLLCNVRISRTVRGETSTDGASQPVRFVNHTLESIEPVVWYPTAAPNAAYEKILKTLNKCPAHDDGLLFAFLQDIEQLIWITRHDTIEIVRCGSHDVDQMMRIVRCGFYDMDRRMWIRRYGLDDMDRTIWII